MSRPVCRARPHRKGDIMSSPHHGKPGRDPHPSTPEDSAPLVASAPPDEANRIFAAGGTPGTTRPLADPAPRFGAGCPGQALPPPPWYRRSGIRIAAAFAALIAGVGIIVAGPGEPGTAPGGTTGTSSPWSASFSLIATDIWEPPPAPPPAAPPPPPEEPPAPAPRRVAPPGRHRRLLRRRSWCCGSTTRGTMCRLPIRKQGFGGFRV